MLHTGQRFITMSYIQLNDIKRITKCDNGKTIVLIIANVTKGNSNWKQPFNVEGFFKRIYKHNEYYLLAQSNTYFTSWS